MREKSGIGSLVHQRDAAELLCEELEIELSALRQPPTDDCPECNGPAALCGQPKPPADVAALVERIENYYSFECEGGPLRLCADWITIKGSITALAQERDRLKVRIEQETAFSIELNARISADAERIEELEFLTKQRPLRNVDDVARIAALEAQLDSREVSRLQLEGMHERVGELEAQLKDERYCHGQTIDSLKKAASEEIQAANKRTKDAQAEHTRVSNAHVRVERLLEIEQGRYDQLEAQLAEAVEWICNLGNEVESGGDRTQTLAKVRAMRQELAEARRDAGGQAVKPTLEQAKQIAIGPWPDAWNIDPSDAPAVLLEEIARLEEAIHKANRTVVGWSQIVEDRETLRAFCRELFAAADWPDGCDIDGFEFQELAIKHGLLLPEWATEPCGNECWCEGYYSASDWEGGVQCYRKADWLAEKSGESNG